MDRNPYKLVALLPIKAHSERIPGKNFREIADKPLFRWVLDVLLSMPEVERIVVNSDAQDLLARHGLVSDRRVLLRERKPEICGDEVSMNRVIADDVAAVRADTYLMTHATNPLLTAATLRRALARFDVARSSGQADSLFSVTRVQARFYRADGAPVNHDPAALLRTQDLEPWFEENSCFYLFSPESFARAGSRIGARPLRYEMARSEAVDIDTPDDWAVAEALLRHHAGPGAAAR